MIPELLTPKDLARTLKVSKQAVYAWVEGGKIPFIRIEKCIRFDPEEIKEWLKERRMAAVNSRCGKNETTTVLRPKNRAGA
jgi:excisionase family DNA binding protein